MGSELGDDLLGGETCQAEQFQDREAALHESETRITSRPNAAT